ncbi:hypothetical protein JHK87_016177 [Glycine soja]|nr:hypothetical protein JHK87_016177 [Glycine soja]
MDYALRPRSRQGHNILKFQTNREVGARARARVEELKQCAQHINNRSAQGANLEARLSVSLVALHASGGLARVLFPKKRSNYRFHDLGFGTNIKTKLKMDIGEPEKVSQ